MDVLQLLVQVFLQELHQSSHFSVRSFPVFHRERIQRQHRNAEFGGAFYNLAHRVDSGPMAGNARQAALAGPAAVAIHDDCDMGGQSVAVDLLRKLLYFPGHTV